MSLAAGHDGRCIDLVGDIHGAADRLRRLVGKLGYCKAAGRWTHSEGSRLVFLGDYADKGAQVGAAVELVRELCDSRVACAITGNHDTNALAFCMRRDGSGIDPGAAWSSALSAKPVEEAWVRAHVQKNISQHCRTLSLDTHAYTEAIRWFSTLPLWLELPGIRAVHAAWIPSAIAKVRTLSAQSSTSRAAWIEASSIDEAIEIQHATRGQSAFSNEAWRLLLDLGCMSDPATGARIDLDPCAQAERLPPDASHAVALERILKGVECPLGRRASFKDASGHDRDQVRVKWFDAAAGRRVADHILVPANARASLEKSLGELDFAAVSQELRESDKNMPPLEQLIPYDEHDAYPAGERPVFVGHYGFMHSDHSVILRDNVACLDTSAFDPTSGRLTAYRWCGERRLEPSRIVQDSAHA
jgi:hypothetical protein